MDVDIPKTFIPDEYTLKCKTYIDKFIISSHWMEMMSVSCEVSVYIYIWFIYILKRFWNITMRQFVH